MVQKIYEDLLAPDILLPWSGPTVFNFPWKQYKATPKSYRASLLVLTLGGGQPMENMVTQSIEENSIYASSVF